MGPLLLRDSMAGSVADSGTVLSVLPVMEAVFLCRVAFMPSRLPWPQACAVAMFSEELLLEDADDFFARGFGGDFCSEERCWLALEVRLTTLILFTLVFLLGDALGS